MKKVKYAVGITNKLTKRVKMKFDPLQLAIGVQERLSLAINLLVARGPNPVADEQTIDVMRLVVARCQQYTEAELTTHVAAHESKLHDFELVADRVGNAMAPLCILGAAQDLVLEPEIEILRGVVNRANHWAHK